MSFSKILDFRTLATMFSALAVVIFFISEYEFSDAPSSLILYVVWRLLGIGDTLFHESGHAIFFWLFGTPAIPSILTVYGTDLAAGVTQNVGHSWIIQILIWIMLMCGCALLYKRQSSWFWPAVIGLCMAIALTFTVFVTVIPVYMGHGSAILAGGVLLYRAWLDLLRTSVERWLNALYGFFLVIHNATFAYKLLYDKALRSEYENHGLENDFVIITDYIHRWNVDGIAKFTLVYALATLIFSFLLAMYFYEETRHGGDSDW